MMASLGSGSGVQVDGPGASSFGSEHLDHQGETLLSRTAGFASYALQDGKQFWRTSLSETTTS